MKDFPRLGFGTYKLEDRDECVEAVKTALDVGYRHVDTAQMYHNEEFVGEGLAESDVDIDDVFVATKLDTDNLGSDDVLETARESAEKLGVDTIDLLYVHWPLDSYDEDETLAALDELVEEGVVANVGLSNFRPDQLESAIETLDAPVFAHQVEMHPMLQQAELRELAAERGHRLVAYSPIARNQVADEEVIVDIAEKHDASPAQVALAWLIEKGATPIPKAASPDHIRDNFAALDLDLDDEDVAAIDDLDSTHRIVDFEEAPWNHA
ncbi:MULTISPECIES: aldo/keto reductase [Haloferax]|uniref:Aldehyde oxidoreductase n=1 Tax=Haloferax gibbonsii TaxID=35746 RepID=A0A0K1IVZ0_HALGI|nr:MULTISPECIES: aldo/keto reductase [Haloferax]AKU08636.1 aldehyde oxidoreductase [Haloferax gibbonsii]QOS12200.1 putative oxidoreductase (aldo-keto reductase family protein) [Haloferax gibbonsii]RDZ52226.1 aldo/keto reductase [Haloferax sp. Atlit-4N]REA03342.1 aldo/keto reductase [Haloferax sp. Atlit-6N]